ncbi:MAG: hypothetical protein FWE28_09330 [Oscillospiraceae bacterium]|nr:hypothetical protein [Oscillospiraceae bacterium]
MEAKRVCVVFSWVVAAAVAVDATVKTAVNAVKIETETVNATNSTVAIATVTAAVGNPSSQRRVRSGPSPT